MFSCSSSSDDGWWLSPKPNAWWFPMIGPDANSNTTAAIARLLRAMLVFEFISLYLLWHMKRHLEAWWMIIIPNIYGKSNL
mgnify:CR=1 FL=1